MKSFHVLSWIIPVCLLWHVSAHADHDHDHDNAMTTPGPVDYSPVFEVHNSSTNMTEGDTAHFFCNVPNRPKKTYINFWKGDEVVAAVYDQTFYMSNLRTHDSGDYWCSLQTDQRKYKSTNAIQINVEKDKDDTPTNVITSTPMYPRGHPTLRLQGSLSLLFEGSSVHFKCEAPGYDSDVSYELSRDGRVIVEQRGSDFYLYNMSVKDTGRYACAVLLVYRTVDSFNSVYIQVKSWNGYDGGHGHYANTTTPGPRYYSPKIELLNNSTNLTIGDRARFFCNVPKAPMDAYYQFWKGDNLLVASTYGPYYEIFNLRVSDSGMYWCSILINQGKFKSYNMVTMKVNTVIRVSTTMNPMGKPTLVLHKPISYYYEGAGVHFECQAPGYGSNISYELSKDGRVVRQQRGNNFFLYNLKLSNSGRYECAVLLVYRKVNSHNSVYIQVVKSWKGDEGERHNGGDSSVPFSFTFLMTSLTLAVTTWPLLESQTT